MNKRIQVDAVAVDPMRSHLEVCLGSDFVPLRSTLAFLQAYWPKDLLDEAFDAPVDLAVTHLVILKRVQYGFSHSFLLVPDQRALLVFEGLWLLLLHSTVVDVFLQLAVENLSVEAALRIKEDVFELFGCLDHLFQIYLA